MHTWCRHYAHKRMEAKKVCSLQMHTLCLQTAHFVQTFYADFLHT
jgi:hypothetical protein